MLSGLASRVRRQLTGHRVVMSTHCLYAWKMLRSSCRSITSGVMVAWIDVWRLQSTSVVCMTSDLLRTEGARAIRGWIWLALLVSRCGTSSDIGARCRYYFAEVGNSSEPSCVGESVL